MYIQKAVIRIVNSVIHYALGCLTSPKFAFICGEPLFLLLGLRSKRGKVDLSKVKRILVVRLDEIGDVVITTPFLRELRRNTPGAWITLVVKPAIYDLVEFCPYVNEVLTYDWQVSGEFENLIRHARALRLAVFHLWKRRFDLAILPRWDVDYYHGTFLSYFSGAPWRVGYSEFVIPNKHSSNKGYDRLFTDLLKDDSLKHEVERNLDVIHFLGGKVEDDNLDLWLSQEDKSFAEEILNKYRVDRKEMLVLFGMRTRDSRKEWPVERFAELGEWLNREYKIRLLLLGEEKDRVLGEILERKLEGTAVNMIGKTTLRQAAALAMRCNLYIGGDTGLMHIAATKIPVIEISCWAKSSSKLIRNSPYRFGPWRVKNILISPERPISPCKEECAIPKPHCILQVTVEDVMVAVRKMLSFIKNG